MARTDANPPMPEFRTDYVLQEVSHDYLTKAVKPKQFIHIDQSECITCEGCVDICPWKCIHMVRPTPSTRRSAPSCPALDPTDDVDLHHRRRRLHPLRARASTGAPPGVIILGQAGRSRRRRRPPPAHQHPRLRLRHAARVGGPTRWPRPWTSSRASAIGCSNLATSIQGSQAWNSIFRPGLDLPQGLHRQPPEPVLRDHELGAVPPAPGEGEAPRGQGQLHALPRRPVASSSSSC